MLELQAVSTGYGRIAVLDAIDLTLLPGAIVAVGGPNGAGKSTLLKCIAGVLPVHGGRISDDGRDITAERVADRVARGIILCPEGRRIFSSLTIEENLLIGATGVVRRRGSAGVAGDLDRIYALFPILAERRKRSGGALSGGQQQMLAIGRALMAQPRILLLDEPSLGLSPLMADEIYETLARLGREGLAMLIVEEAAGRPLAIAQRGMFLRRGRIVRSGAAADLASTADFTADYLGHAA